MLNSLSFRKLTAFLLLLLTMSVYAQQLVDDPVGVLSLIEDRVLINPDEISRATAEDIRRVTPFIEVINVDIFEHCVERGMDEQTCGVFEWSVNFLQRDNIEAFEEDLVIAWARFELRSWFRAQLETGALNGLVSCNIGQPDLLWYTLTGNIMFPGSEYCDNFGGVVISRCFWQCDLTGPLDTPCPGVSPSCSQCAAQGFARALSHQSTTYYAEYLDDARQALMTHLPTALQWWEGVFDGAAIVPVADYSVILPQRMMDVFNNAVNNNILAPRYFQSATENIACIPYSPLAFVDVLHQIPGYSADRSQPGIPSLEEVKVSLSSRESVGETRHRFGEWVLGKDHLLPKFTEAGGGFFGSGTEAYDSIANPTTQACYGYASIYEVYGKWETFAIPRIITRLEKCWQWAVPPYPSLNPVPAFVSPVLFTGTRIHTALETVPEGYGIPRVKGTPFY